MSYKLPSPPKLKATIIQLNKDVDVDDNNYEILTNDYRHGQQDSQISSQFQQQKTQHSQSQGQGEPESLSPPVSFPNKKKRRRSSANIDSHELAKRKHETKQLHSVIEKKRRIKINREFEALKYIIPACRNPTTNINESNSSSSKSITNNSNNNNNNNKIDGMYKLTILKSSVEYILYLHHIIQQQHNIINSSNNNSNLNYDYDINFTKMPLDVNQYRNLEIDYSFNGLIDESIKSDINDNMNNGLNIDDDSNNILGKKKKKINSVTSIQEVEEDNENLINNSLPSPGITPDMAPILSILNNFANKKTPTPNKDKIVLSPIINNNHNKDKSLMNSTDQLLYGISPFTIPQPSTVSSTTLNCSNNLNSYFKLPEAALNDSNEPNKTNKSNEFDEINKNDKNDKNNEIDYNYSHNSTLKNSYPIKKYFKSKISPNNLIISNSKNLNNEEIIESDDNDNDDNETSFSNKDASKTLLSLRKSSIDSLLN